MRFVDLHCHLLPGLDDGPTSIEESIAMLRFAYQRRTLGIVATPHAFQPMFPSTDTSAVVGSFERLVQQVDNLSQEDDDSSLREMTLYLGAENLVSAEFLSALENREVLTINGSRYVLVEFPRFLSYQIVESALEQILIAELIPVLAHVERYEFLHHRPGRLARLRREGCVIQVNAEALLQGGMGVEPRLAHSAATRGLVDVVASDGHDLVARPPDLQAAFESLLREFPEESLRTWMWENPARILANQELVEIG